MILVECKPDRILIKKLFPALSMKAIRCKNGKSEVIKHLSKTNHQELTQYSRVLGMVDKDPGKTIIKLFDEFNLIEEYSDFDFKLYKHPNNRLVIELNPRLEEWILSTAKSENIDIRDYDLPEDGNEFHEIVNSNIEDYTKLVDALTKNRRIQKLKEIISNIYF